MADSLGSAVLTLSVDDQQFKAGLDAASQKAKQAGQQLQNSFGAGGQTLTSLNIKLTSLRSELDGVKIGSTRFKELNAEIKKTESAISKAKGVSGITSGSGGIFGGLAGGLTAAAIGAAAVGAAVVGVGAAAVQSAGSVQKLQAAFTGLTGSAEAAAKLRQQLFDLSKTTPFKNEEILQASQRFLAVGVNVESLNGTINRVGTLAAQAGQPLERLALIYAQVYAKGRLQGEENLQLLEAGVDLSQELAQVTGLTGSALQDAMSKGQIGINAFNEALVLATGDMTALQQAGKAVDVQFNNIGDNLGQLFGGFAQAISPALSAAFAVINDIFDSAFPDLESIVQFFAPLTTEAKRFADVLGSSPAIIDIIAQGLKSIGGAVIQNIADGISSVSDLLSRVDQTKFIQGFINAEIVVRRIFLAASALGAQLVKNAELTFRAVSNPIQFGKDIIEAGGFGKFIEKEYEDVERKWNDWANSKPLTFPDLVEDANKQADQIEGNLSNKATKALEGLQSGSLESFNKALQAANEQLSKLRVNADSINFRSAVADVASLEVGLRAAQGATAGVKADILSAGIAAGDFANSFENVNSVLQNLEELRGTLDIDSSAFVNATADILQTQDQLQQLDGKKATIEIELLRKGLEDGSIEDTLTNRQKLEQAFLSRLRNTNVNDPSFALDAQRFRNAQREREDLERKINEGPGSQKYEDDLNKQFETALKTREQLEEGGKKIRENIEQAGKAIRSTLEGSYNLLNSSVQESVLAQARSRINFNLFDSGKLRTPGDVFSAAAASDSIRDNQRAIATGRAELVDNSKKLEQNNAELNNLAVQIDTLARKDWKVNVNVNTDSGASSVQLG